MSDRQLGGVDKKTFRSDPIRSFNSLVLIHTRKYVSRVLTSHLSWIRPTLKIKQQKRPKVGTTQVDVLTLPNLKIDRDLIKKKLFFD